MKALVESTKNGPSVVPSGFIVGSFPKVSIDMRMKMLDSHGPREPIEHLGDADNLYHSRLAFLAADRIFTDLQPAFRYIGVIKVWFYWNLNHGGSPSINVTVVLVDPLTDEKSDIYASGRIPGRLNHAKLDSEDHELVAKISTDLRSGIRLEVKRLAIMRDNLSSHVADFDSLFAPVAPAKAA